MVAHRQPSIRPRIKVASSVHSTAAALVVADRPVLLKRLRAIDARLIVPPALSQLVRRAVAGDFAQNRGARRWVVGTEVFDYVVLHEGVAHPAVDGEVGVAVGLVCTGVANGSMLFSKTQPGKDRREGEHTAHEHRGSNPSLQLSYRRIPS